ncbi:RNA polymerase sigma-70 factor [Dysgonomonas sp. BGC7]|uniref:RNA polymerase sigma-70 factor n=1 Tax=Dysgonomonas sp. BGC7 TaxID=1658008 RepID=UPI0009E1BF4A|nr:RNA polymerase sigma-70 factor [Dysgonomonas sp. BGC7]MBD8389493.1 RNA polymerase sigma-70 factor [Dysgonomonas sp. BGC7]
MNSILCTMSNSSELLFEKMVMYDDKEAFAELFSLYYPPLCIFAKKYIEEEDSSKDIVQDIFVYFWESRDKLPPKIDVRNYLMVSVKNSCLNYLRKKKTAQKYQENVLEKHRTGTQEQDYIYLLSELEEQLSTALSKLPDNIRLVFEKNKIEGKTYEEIAAELCISVRTAKRYNAQAIELLKKMLKDYSLLLLYLYFIADL